MTITTTMTMILTHSKRFQGQYLTSTQLGSLNGDNTNKIYNVFSNDSSDRVVFDNDTARWKAIWALAEGAKPDNLEDTPSCTIKIFAQMFPQGKT